MEVVEIEETNVAWWMDRVAALLTEREDREQYITLLSQLSKARWDYATHMYINRTRGDKQSEETELLLEVDTASKDLARFVEIGIFNDS